MALPWVTMRAVPSPTLALLVSAVVLAGCTGGGQVGAAPPSSAPAASVPTSASPPTSASAAATTEPVATLPAVPTPKVPGDCPYLSAADVAAFNGERVASVRLDPTQNPPACFFDQGDGGQLLSVWVYRAPSMALATAAVNRAAPVASTNPANQPAGWTGGSAGGAGGAVYAVAKGTVVVVVTTNQEQSVKARRVTEQVITTLSL